MDDLAERVARGDRAAFAELYDRCADRLHHYLTVQLGSRQDADDVLQETWLRVEKRVAKFDRWVESVPEDERDLEAMGYFWINRLVLNTFTDHLRSLHTLGRDRDRQVPIPDLSRLQFAAGLINSCTSPTAALRRKELQERVNTVLASLKSEDQHVLTLRSMLELSTSQTAEILDLEEPAVRKRHGRAMLRFRDAWVARYGTEGLPT